MRSASSWTLRLPMPDSMHVRKVSTLFISVLLSIGLAAPAHADQVEVDAARAAYKSATAAAVKAHKASITKAQSDYLQALKAPADAVAVANAQAKALADQATKASQAKTDLDLAIAEAGSDRKLRAKASRDFDAQLRKIQQETEKALRDARLLGNPKTAREYAKTVRDQAMRTAQETLTKAFADALAKLNAVLAANGLPPEKG